MKKITIVILASILITTITNGQRGESPKLNADANPYDKIINEPIVGKRTAKFLINLIRPEILESSFQSSPCNDYVELSNTRIEQFNAFVERFNSMEKEPKQMEAANKKYTADTKLSNKLLEELSYKLGYIQKQGTFTADAQEPLENLLCRAKGAVQSMKSILAYAQQIKNIFPSTPNIDAVISTAKVNIALYNDNKTILATIKQNLNAGIADITMPVAVTKNTEWENLFKDYCVKKYLGYTYLKQALISADWFIKKNEISNLPEYRQITSVVAAKRPDGKCVLIKLDLYQYYTAGKYGNPSYKEVNTQEIICDKLK